MSVSFSYIKDVPTVEEPNENDNLVLISDGQVKQMPASSFAAASSSLGGLPPVYLRGKSTSTRPNMTVDSSEALIYDPNEVGITNGTDLRDYMRNGGPIYFLGDTYSPDEAPDYSVCCLVLGLTGDSYNSPTKFYFDILYNGTLKTLYVEA